MESPSQSSVTQMLVDLRDGQNDVFDDLYEEVYTQLRQRAREQRRRWKGDPTLQTTALAHEAYLKLIDQSAQSWESRSHFFAVAARAMRHILINEARRKQAQKRGGDASVLSLEHLRESLGREQATQEERAETIVLLDAALEQFEKVHPRPTKVVECRFFGGMTIEETAEAVGVSTSTVSRDWDLAQAWLYREMKTIQNDGESSSQDQ